MSNTKFKFENLRIWQDSMELAEDLFKLSKKYPVEEQFNLTSQLRRAADSISLNIAEGSIGQSNKEQSKFIGYSVRSLAETVTCLHKAKNRKYINQEEFDDFYFRCYRLMNSLISFRDKLK